VSDAKNAGFGWVARSTTAGPKRATWAGLWRRIRCVGFFFSLAASPPRFPRLSRLTLRFEFKFIFGSIARAVPPPPGPAFPAFPSFSGAQGARGAQGALSKGRYWSRNRDRIRDQRPDRLAPHCVSVCVALSSSEV